MLVKIYIDAKIKGRGLGKGWYAAVAEFTKGNGEVITREISGEEEQTTYYRGILTATVQALKILKPCTVIVYTDCTFVMNIAKDGRPEKWKREEWRKSTGKEVKNKELWQQYLDEEKRHEKIEFRYSKHHDYKVILDKLLEENKEKVKETA